MNYYSNIKYQLNHQVANLPFVCVRRELKHFVSKEIFLFTSIDIRICHINVESQRDMNGCNFGGKKYSILKFCEPESKQVATNLKVLLNQNLRNKQL